jgi:antitoxin YefM
MAMVTAIKQFGIVGKDGKIELHAPELAEGTAIEVILLVESQDETEYLLSTKANRDRLLAAIANVERGENLVSFSAEEWHEKYHI